MASCRTRVRSRRRGRARHLAKVRFTKVSGRTLRTQKWRIPGVGLGLSTILEFVLILRVRSRCSLLKPKLSLLPVQNPVISKLVRSEAHGLFRLERKESHIKWNLEHSSRKDIAQELRGVRNSGSTGLLSCYARATCATAFRFVCFAFFFVEDETFTRWNVLGPA